MKSIEIPRRRADIFLYSAFLLLTLIAYSVTGSFPSMATTSILAFSIPAAWSKSGRVAIYGEEGLELVALEIKDIADGVRRVLFLTNDQNTAFPSFLPQGRRQLGSRVAGTDYHTSPTHYCLLLSFVQCFNDFTHGPAQRRQILQ